MVFQKILFFTYKNSPWLDILDNDSRGSHVVLIVNITY